MKKILLPIILLSFVFVNQKSYSHCEVPCGIYGDELRIAMLYEHFTTIEKAMKKIEELSNASDEDYMMITRWTITKEEHAKEIQHIANQYFLTQRVKPVDEEDADNYAKYQKQLSLLHHIIVYSMKAKQTTDVKFVEQLRTTLGQFEELYFEGKHRHKIEQHDH
jgi:nickel superoxide dismutase